MKGQTLLCDFHIHTAFSDGECTLEEVVDLYGSAGFDAIAVTDHLVDSHWRRRNQDRKSPGIEDFNAYLQAIKAEAERALVRYSMLVIPGVEVSNNTGGYHILGLGMKEPVDPDGSVEDVVAALHGQGAAAVACHPYSTPPADDRPLTYLWDERNRFRNLFDAWELANSKEFFKHVASEGLSFLANADFHRPKDFSSWKNLLRCERSVPSILARIRSRRRPALHLLWEGAAEEAA